MKKQNQNRFSLLLLVMISSISFAQNQLGAVDGSNVNSIGPSGNKNHIMTPVAQSSMAMCVVDGVFITTSGNFTTNYVAPSSINNYCGINAASLNATILNWTGSGTNTGQISYNFSQPILSVTLTYTIINSNDVGTISINGPGMQLSNPCGVNISGNVLSCAYNSGFGDVTLTVSSDVPFTQVTLTNTGGQSGWVTGNPCNFNLTLPPVDIISVPKMSFIYCNNSNLPIGNVFNGVTINGNSANAFNATINPIIPPLGIPGVAYNITPIEGMPSIITIASDGSVYLLSGLVNIDVEFFVQICSGNSCSLPIRINIRNCPQRQIDPGKLIISPNPSKDGVFNIAFERKINSIFMEVFDSTGEKVYYDTLENKENYILNLNKLSKGTYILKLHDNQEIISKNIIID